MYAFGIPSVPELLIIGAVLVLPILIFVAVGYFYQANKK